MNIYKQELRMALKTAIVWTMSLIFIMVLFMLMFPFISKDAALMQNLLNNFPPELTETLGLNNIDFSTILGFYSFLFMYTLLIGSIFAMKLGISVLSEEIRVKAADFLISKPVKRTKIVTAKVMSVITFIVIQNVLYIIATFISVKLITDQSFDYYVFLLINLSLLFVQFFFVAIGLLMSVLIKKIKTVLPITLGTVFGFFIIQLLNQSVSDAKLAYLTPFSYFEASKIVENGGYDSTFLMVNWVIIITSTLLSYVIYNKKDMPSI